MDIIYLFKVLLEENGLFFSAFHLVYSAVYIQDHSQGIYIHCSILHRFSQTQKVSLQLRKYLT